MKIALIGAGNVATHIGMALRAGGHEIVAVFSRTMEAAQELSEKTGGRVVTSLNDTGGDADVYLISVKDDVLASLLPDLCHGREEQVFIHTAGSIGMDVFAGKARHYGVLYPMQTFSKNREVNFSVIPCFIEANDEQARNVIATLAGSISKRIHYMTSDERKHLHLAAVFANNFVNHCYTLSEKILNHIGLPFDVMLPLIDETTHKVHHLDPLQAQTGPAVRGDKKVTTRQAELLNENPTMREIYELMSQSIFENSERKNDTQ